jgi:hypothetical protein
MRGRRKDRKNGAWELKPRLGCMGCHGVAVSTREGVPSRRSRALTFLLEGPSTGRFSQAFGSPSFEEATVMWKGRPLLPLAFFIGPVLECFCLLVGLEFYCV